MLHAVKFASKILPVKRLKGLANIKAALNKLKGAPVLALDTETTGLQWWKEGFRPFYLSLCDGRAGYGFYLQPAHAAILRATVCNPTHVRGKIHVYHNAKFDLHALATIGVEDPAIVHDTMLLAPCLDENDPKSLDYLTKTYLDEGVGKMKDTVAAWFKDNGYKAGEWKYEDLPPKILEPYAIRDVVGTWFYYMGAVKHLDVLDADEHHIEQGPHGPIGVKRIFDIETDALKALWAMERRGYQLDIPHFKALTPELEGQAKDAEEKVRAALAEYDPAVARRVNLNSPQDLATIFLDVLKVDPKKLPLTNGGKPSFNADALEYITHVHPLAQDLLTYREAEKLLNTFGKNLLGSVDKSGAIHADFRQMGARTGRMSCSNPNLQNLPAGPIRQGFIPRKGFKLFFFDYSQIEMRIFAHYSEDPVLLDAIRGGRDLHTETAAHIFGKTVDNVTKEERQRAKTINFATIYGAGARGLAKQLKCDYSDARAFRDEYMKRFPNIAAFLRDAATYIHTRGWVRTYWGRRRHLDVQKDYVAVNAIVQGTATGDMIKIALGRVHKFLDGSSGKFGTLNSGVVSVVHDEIQVEVDDRVDSRNLVSTTKELMEDFKMFDVPIKVDVSWSAKNWNDKEEWGDKPKRKASK